MGLQVGSVCNGMVCMVVYSTLTWAAAPLAYIRSAGEHGCNIPCYNLWLSTTASIRDRQN